MYHRTKAEGQSIPTATEESPEGVAPELENTGGRFLPRTTGSAEVAYDYIARYRFAEWYIRGHKTIDLGRGAGGYDTYALSGFAENLQGMDLSEEAVAYDSWLGGRRWLRS